MIKYDISTNFEFVTICQTADICALCALKPFAVVETANRFVLKSRTHSRSRMQSLGFFLFDTCPMRYFQRGSLVHPVQVS